MISWTRAILGQTQESDAPEVPETLEAALEMSTVEPVRSRAPAPPPRLPRRTVPWAPIAFLILAGAALLGGGWLFTEQRAHTRDLEQQLSLAHSEITQLHQQNTELLQQLTTFQTERTALDERVFSLGVQISSAATELTRADARLAQAQQLAQRLTEANVRLQVQLEATWGERDAARGRAAQLLEDTRALGQSVTRLRARIALLERRSRHLAVQVAMAKRTPPQAPVIVAAAPAPAAPAAAPVPPSAPDASSVATTSTPPSTAEPAQTTVAAPTQAGAPADAAVAPAPVQLPPVVVTTSPAIATRSANVTSTATANGTGRLVTVNLRHRFVVIDRGSQDGVQAGMMFDLVQGGRVIGTAMAIRVRPKFSACDLSRETDPRLLHVGDTVLQRPPNS